MNIFKDYDKGLFFDNNFISFKVDEKTSFIEKSLGKIPTFCEFAAVYRKEVFFQNVKTGKTISQIPDETQWLLIHHTNDTYTVIVPLVNEPIRCAIKSIDDELFFYAETGDDAIEVTKGTVLYYITGKNPYEIMEKAAKDISEFLPDLKLRKDKQIPEFVNYFGWCTWDSFYDKVTSKDVIDGLENFREGGFVPKLVILDDGWQSVEEVDPQRGLHQLNSFLPNEKFNHNLKETVYAAKNQYDVKMFMVWHAIMGYWGGVYPKSEEMKHFDVKLKIQNHSKTMFKVNPEYSQTLHFPYGFVNPDKAFDFYDTYHSYLRGQGVDGVKVDVQSALEGVGYGEGGRVKVVKSFRKGLEASVNRNFDGNIINCMSCSNDHILNALSTNVYRSSNDFFPDRADSHSEHILTNAFVSMFMGEFVICDWDMFQTKHEYGEFHAAARAISGSPVYVSDKVNEHNFDIIKKLTIADGKLPLCTKNARPTKDSLFIRSEEFDDILKVFNFNEHNAVIGAFNLSDKDAEGRVSPSDIDDIFGEKFAVYDYKNKDLLLCSAKDSIDCKLSQKGYNIYTVSRIKEGFAAIGLTDKFNSGGTFTHLSLCDNFVMFKVLDGGEFLACCEKKPKKVLVNNKTSVFKYKNFSLKIDLPNEKVNTVVIIM